MKRNSKFLLQIIISNRAVILLACIVLSACMIRLHKLETIPSGLHQDEVVNAYIGRYILTNGVDIYGNPWPLHYFNKWGDYPPVVPMYISALGTYVFGLNRLGARFVNALVGVFIIIPIYYISLLVFKRKKTALFSAGLIAILPWHIAFSRMATEGILASTVYMSALALYLHSRTAKKIIWFIFSCILFFSTYFLYPGYRISIPLTYVALFAFAAIEKKSKRFLLVSILLIVVSFAATLAISSTQWGSARFIQTSFLRTYDPTASQAYIFNESNIFLARFFNTKYFYIAREFFRQYASYFLPQYLFVDGGMPQWFSFPNSGLVSVFCLFLLFPMVLPHFFGKKISLDKGLFALIVFLMILAPIPAALATDQSPNTHRSLLLGVFLVLFLSYGFYLIQDRYIKKIPIWTIVVFFAMVESTFFFHNYFQHVSMYTAIPRSDGNFQAAQYIQKNKNKYDLVYMMATGWFPIYYLYTSGNFDKSLIGTIPVGLRMESVENIKFIDRDFFSDEFTLKKLIGNSMSKKSLIIVNSGSAIPKDIHIRIIGSINASNHLPIYTLLSFEH